MMNITDEEMAQYVANKSRTGKRLTERQLIGRWKEQSMAELDVEKEYHADHTFTNRSVNYMSFSYYTGQVEFHYFIHGTWELQGDSLITVISPGYSYEIDRSHIHYHPELEQTVTELIKSWAQSIDESIAEREEEGEHRSAAFASIDGTGKKIELRDKEETRYLLRKED